MKEQVELEKEAKIISAQNELQSALTQLYEFFNEYEQRVEREKTAKYNKLNKFVEIEESLLQAAQEVTDLLDLKLKSESKARLVADFQQLRQEGENYLAQLHQQVSLPHDFPKLTKLPPFALQVSLVDSSI